MSRRASASAITRPRAGARELEERPLWVFSSRPVGDPKDDKPFWTEPDSLARRMRAPGGREHVVSGGLVPANPSDPGEEAMVEGIPPEFRDRRDWDEIRGWARRIAAELRYR